MILYLDTSSLVKLYLDETDRFRAEDVVFSSFDAHLLKAARSSGLSIFHPVDWMGSGFVMEGPEFPWALETGR